MNEVSHANGISRHPLPLDWQELLRQLSKPFNPEHIQWRAGATNKDKTKAMALAYAEPRTYEDRLNTVCPGAWHVTFEPWGDNRIICKLTIHGVTRSSTGEDTSSTDNAGTTAEAQAFKRACSKFGLGRYLYDLPTTWVPYDARARRLTETPRLPSTPSSRQFQSVAPPAPSGSATDTAIGNDRAAAMHRELARAGLPSSEHYAFATAITKRNVRSLASLTEAEAARIWRTATSSSQAN